MSDLMANETTETPVEYLIGIRLRESALAEDYKIVGNELELHVGDFAVVETTNATAVGEVRRARREVPEIKRDRLYRRVLRLATPDEARDWRRLRQREKDAIVTCARMA